MKLMLWTKESKLMIKLDSEYVGNRAFLNLIKCLGPTLNQWEGFRGF